MDPGTATIASTVIGGLMGGGNGDAKAMNRLQRKIMWWDFGNQQKFLDPTLAMAFNRLAQGWNYAPYRQSLASQREGLDRTYDAAEAATMRALQERGLGRSSLATGAIAGLQGQRASEIAAADAAARREQYAQQAANMALIAELLGRGSGSAAGLAATAGAAGAQANAAYQQRLAGIQALMAALFAPKPQMPPVGTPPFFPPNDGTVPTGNDSVMVPADFDFSFLSRLPAPVAR